MLACTGPLRSELPLLTTQRVRDMKQNCLDLEEQVFGSPARAGCDLKNPLVGCYTKLLLLAKGCSNETVFSFEDPPSACQRGGFSVSHAVFGRVDQTRAARCGAEGA